MAPSETGLWPQRRRRGFFRSLVCAAGVSPWDGPGGSPGGIPGEDSPGAGAPGASARERGSPGQAQDYTLAPRDPNGPLDSGAVLFKTPSGAKEGAFAPGSGGVPACITDASVAQIWTPPPLEPHKDMPMESQYESQGQREMPVGGGTHTEMGMEGAPPDAAHLFFTPAELDHLHSSGPGTGESTPYTSSEHEILQAPPQGGGTGYLFRRGPGVPEDTPTFSSSEVSPYRGLPPAGAAGPGAVYRPAGPHEAHPRGGCAPAGSFGGNFAGPDGGMVFNTAEMVGRDPPSAAVGMGLGFSEFPAPEEGPEATSVYGRGGSRPSGGGGGGGGDLGSGSGSGSGSEDAAYNGSSISPSQVKSVVHALQSPVAGERLHAAVLLRRLTKADNAGRRAMAEAGAVGSLFEMMQEQHPGLVEAGLYALLVLCINEEVRWNLSGALVIPLVLRLTCHPAFSIQEGATAMLFCLSGIDENKILIGNMGGIPVLMDVLAGGSGRMKRDVLRTLYNLSLLSINKTTLLQHRVVHSIVRLVSGAPAHKLSEVAVSLLRNLATRDEGRDAIVASHGVPVLGRVLECGSPMGKEEAVSILLVLCTRNAAHKTVVRRSNLTPSLRSLAVSGSPRARARAEELLLELTEHQKNHK